MRWPFCSRQTTFGLLGFAVFSTGLVWQMHSARHDLRGTLLQRGRIVLTSAPARPDLKDAGWLGPAAYANDGDLSTGSLLQFPAAKGPGVYWLIDLGLSHWPPLARPRPRQPRQLLVYNGACSGCPHGQFERWGRIKTLRLELYERKANNPDKEFLHEPTLLVAESTHLLPDAAGPFVIALNRKPATTSPGYPRNVRFLVAKLIVLSTYPGRTPGNVALGEVVYGDSPASGPQANTVHYWR